MRGSKRINLGGGQFRPLTQLRRLARLTERVIQIALGAVTNDVLMKYSQSLGANGSDQEKVLL